MRAVQLVGGPADGEIVEEIAYWMTEFRVCKICDSPAILADCDSPIVADACVESYLYKQHAQNENLFYFFE